jgi:hypothetical protein
MRPTAERLAHLTFQTAPDGSVMVTDSLRGLSLPVSPAEIARAHQERPGARLTPFQWAAILAPEVLDLL